MVHFVKVWLLPKMTLTVELQKLVHLATPDTQSDIVTSSLNYN